MTQGRTMLLTLLAFALSTAAWADDIDFSSGTFEHGTITSSFGKHFRVRVVGSMDTITLNIPNLSCSKTQPECFFATGTVTVVNPKGVMVFTDGLKAGYIEIGTGTIRTEEIAAYLLPDSMGTGGFTEFNIKFRGHTLLGGDGEVDPVPEPGVLDGLLLGTGVIGLAEMTRRKLTLGT